ncbi:MAG: alpha/beta fold hydrolase [Oscillospiraceae bacterium]
MTTLNKKKSKKIILIIVAVLIVVLIAVAQVATFAVYNETFNIRYSSANDKSLLTFNDFDSLSKQEAEFVSNKGQKLSGDFYMQKSDEKDYKAVVVLSHGFGGGGYISYLPQINYLAQNGYLVFAFDNTGNDESEGNSVVGLPQGIIDLDYALDYVRQQDISKNLPIMLYGHSWGAYSTCAVLETENDIKAVASLSGFNKSKDMLIDQGISMYGSYVKMLSPFLSVCDFVKFGKYSSYSSYKGLEKTNAKVLIIHSDDDDMINIENSFDLYQEKLGNRPNLTFMRMTGKVHQVFQSQSNRDYNKQKNVEFRKIKEANGNKMTDEMMNDFFKDYDSELANELDLDVMKKIVDFYDSSIK